MHLSAFFMDKILGGCRHSASLIKVQKALETVANASCRQERVKPGTNELTWSIAGHFKKRVVCKDKTSIFIQDETRGGQPLDPGKRHGLQDTSFFEGFFGVLTVRDFGM